MKRDLKNAVRDAVQNKQPMNIAPIRSMKEFIGGNDWISPEFQNPSKLQEHVLQNLIYYQTNYLIFALTIFGLVGFYSPTSTIFGLAVIASLVTAFKLASDHNRLTEFLHPATRNRPLIVLVILLVLAFFIIKMFGSVLAFLVGTALPLALIVVHATLRKETFQNKVVTTVEHLGFTGSPVGLLLHWLGLHEMNTNTSQKK